MPVAAAAVVSRTFLRSAKAKFTDKSEVRGVRSAFILISSIKDKKNSLMQIIGEKV